MSSPVSPVRKAPISDSKDKQQSLDSPPSFTLNATRYLPNRVQHSPIQKPKQCNQVYTPLSSERSPRLLSPLLKPLYPSHQILNDDIDDQEEDHSAKQQEFSAYITLKRSRLSAPTLSPCSVLSNSKTPSSVHHSPIQNQVKQSPQSLKLQKQLRKLEEKIPASKSPNQRKVVLCSAERSVLPEISSLEGLVDLDSIDQLCENF